MKTASEISAEMLAELLTLRVKSQHDDEQIAFLKKQSDSLEREIDELQTELAQWPT